MKIKCYFPEFGKCQFMHLEDPQQKLKIQEQRSEIMNFVEEKMHDNAPQASDLYHKHKKCLECFGQRVRRFDEKFLESEKIDPKSLYASSQENQEE